MITTVVVISLSVMFIEAFALEEPGSPERAFVFYVNIPIIIDIAFVISFWIVHHKYLKPPLY